MRYLAILLVVLLGVVVAQRGGSGRGQHQQQRCFSCDRKDAGFSERPSNPCEFQSRHPRNPMPDCHGCCTWWGQREGWRPTQWTWNRSSRGGWCQCCHQSVCRG